MNRRGFPWWGWLGAAMLAAGPAATTLTDLWFLSVYFTPWMWTGYLLLVDGVLLARTGASWLAPHPSRFLLLLPISLVCWLIFEAYNLHLRNWAYIGLPDTQVLTWAGYVWSFATIWPALLLTADLLESFGLEARVRPLRITPGRRRGLFVAGLLLSGVPLLLPGHLAAYTFVLVWVGWVPLLESFLVGADGVPSLLRDLERGDATRWWSLGLSGLVCGLLWESWNVLASAKWVYIFPIFQEYKVFEMPAPGFLGFIPFAWEAQAMYAAVLLGLSRLFRKRPDAALRPHRVRSSER